MRMVRAVRGSPNKRATRPMRISARSSAYALRMTTEQGPDAFPRSSYTVAEVARSTGMSRRWIQMLCNSGEMRAYRSGRRIFIDADAVEEYKRRNRIAESQ